MKSFDSNNKSLESMLCNPCMLVTLNFIFQLLETTSQKVYSILNFILYFTAKFGETYYPRTDIAYESFKFAIKKKAEF